MAQHDVWKRDDKARGVKESGKMRFLQQHDQVRDGGQLIVNQLCLWLCARLMLHIIVDDSCCGMCKEQQQNLIQHHFQGGSDTLFFFLH